jgi:Tol biopolymer transport system component
VSVGGSYVVRWSGNRILYPSSSGGQATISGISPGRATAGTIIARADSPAATSDGRQIVYVSTETGAQAGLWKADVDGRQPLQLVSDTAIWPTVTPDDRHVVFVSLRGGVQSPWIVPLDGGTPTQVTDLFATRPDVSPDGESIMFGSLDAQNRSIVVVCDLPACTSHRQLPALPLNAKWTPDGQGIAYPVQSDIWVQPLDGTPPRQLTHLADDRTIADFAWSRDGQQIAIARATSANDIVLLDGFTEP